MSTLTEYNNNPGNLRPPKGQDNFYSGQIGVDDKGFAVFENKNLGKEALIGDINSKIKNGLNNPHDFIDKYSPAGEENPEDARDNYKLFLTHHLGLEGTKEKFPENSAEKIAEGIAKFENGSWNQKDKEQPNSSENKINISEPTEKLIDIKSNQINKPTKIPKDTATGIGATLGAGMGLTAGLTGLGLKSKYDLAQLLASYPDAMNAFKAGATPSEVAKVALNHIASTKNLPTSDNQLPPGQGPLEGNPAGGYQTQNWLKSSDTQNRYTDVGLNARDKAEAHQMKLQAMAAEDKIRKIAPEFAHDPNRAGLFISQSAGRGPSPRFGGTPNVPIKLASEAIESPTLRKSISNLASSYLPFLSYPIKGGLAGASLGLGTADVINKINENKPVQAGLSATGTMAGTAAPFVGGSLGFGLTGAGALIPAALQLYNDPEARQRFIEGMSGKSPFANRGFGLD